MDVQVFVHSLFGAVRTIHDEEGIPMFAVRDICKVLGIQNSSRVVKRLYAEDIGRYTIETTGGQQELVFTNEAGLYNLVFLSRKPVALSFRRWMASEVLPALRQTGEYQMPEFKTVLVPIPVYLGGGFIEVKASEYTERVNELTAEWFDRMDALEAKGV